MDAEAQSVYEGAESGEGEPQFRAAFSAEAMRVELDAVLH